MHPQAGQIETVRDSSDYVVVGSGAAGASAAWELVQRGHDVVLVEEGPRPDKSGYTRDMLDSIRQLYRDSAMTVIFGRSVIPYLQGCVVGGTTVINSAIVWRPPDDVYESWEKLFGLGDVFDRDELDKIFLKIEEELNVRPVESTRLGRPGDLMKLGCEKLGIGGTVINRNELGCEGSGRCAQGCPTAAKQSCDVTYVPWAEQRGMRLYNSCRAEKILQSNGRASGIMGNISPSGGMVEIEAKKGVLLAASAVQTPSLLRMNGLTKGGAGDHFQAHPGYAPIGIFDDPVDMWDGATQGYETNHFRNLLKFKLEGVNLPAELAMARLPGTGASLLNGLAEIPYALIIGVQLRAEAEGKVRCGRLGTRISFTPTPKDMERMRAGGKIAAEIMFAAGARKVYPGITGMPETIDRDELAHFDRASLDPRAYTMVVTHMFSTARMGDNPETSVVSRDFQVHDLPGLYIIDSSVFPTNLGVNPQHFIMAVARMAAARISER